MLDRVWGIADYEPHGGYNHTHDKHDVQQLTIETVNTNIAWNFNPMGNPDIAFSTPVYHDLLWLGYEQYTTYNHYHCNKRVDCHCKKHVGCHVLIIETLDTDVH
jgi:hypothetical protein